MGNVTVLGGPGDFKPLKSHRIQSYTFIQNCLRDSDRCESILPITVVTQPVQKDLAQIDPCFARPRSDRVVRSDACRIWFPLPGRRFRRPSRFPPLLPSHGHPLFNLRTLSVTGRDHQGDSVQVRTVHFP